MLYFVLWTSVLVWLLQGAFRILYNIFLHPLRKFPGPLAARTTEWWKTYIEVVEGESMVDVLVRLHHQYGEIIRVAPNQLHFANPEAYHEIYNPGSRWEKEKKLYEAFGEDHSSFGLRTYAEAKVRKDALQPLFSRKAILSMQTLVREKVNHLASILIENNTAGKSSDMLFAFRCFAMDTITAFCFGSSVKALDEPDFQAPIVLAIDNSLPTFHLFHHFPLFRKLIFSLPPWLAVKASPETAGLTQLQVILQKQVVDVMNDRSKLKEAPHPTIYHRLLDPDAYKGHLVPNAIALYEEGQTMLFAGGVTVGDASMTALFHILDQPELYQRLRSEIRTAWPDINRPPSLEALEALPVLTATIKETLRFTPGACASLLRIVPNSGAVISGVSVPGGTIVGMASTFVHRSDVIFEDPDSFKPERWLGEGAKGLEKNLVAFSRGPRSCLGMNLAYCELYFLFSTMFRRFDMKLDGTTKEDLVWRDCFTPYYPRRHLHVWCKMAEK